MIEGVDLVRIILVLSFALVVVLVLSPLPLSLEFLTNLTCAGLFVEFVGFLDGDEDFGEVDENG